MLFDLRGRGRRRTVRTIYLGLALLMGVGLIGFGIGGGAFSGGLFNSLSSGGSSGTSSYQTQIDAAQKKTQKHPKDPAAWAAYAQALYLEAGTGSNYDQTAGEFTATAKPLLKRIAAAWQKYLALKPDTANTGLANQMFQVYEGPGALAEPGPAAQALQIVIAHTTPASQTLYEDLAVYSYQSGDSREGDLASAKAIALAPKAQRAQLKTEFAALKANPNGTASTSSISTVNTASGVVPTSASVSTISVTANSTAVSSSTTASVTTSTSTPAATTSTTSSASSSTK